MLAKARNILILFSAGLMLLLVGCGVSTTNIDATDEVSPVNEEAEIVNTATPVLIATSITTENSPVAPQAIPTKPSGQPNRPEDKYACAINSEGYCIFSGIPHEAGLKPNTEEIVDRNGAFLFFIHEAVAVNSSGKILQAKGTPAMNGDELVKHSRDGLTDDEKAFHKVMAIMFPIRNALMYDIADTSETTWDELVSELKVREIKNKTFTDGATPRDNYYGRQGIFELAKNPNGKDIHHDIMKFLEEAGLYLLCHVTSDGFNKMLQDTHPEGHNPCKDAEITLKISFPTPSSLPNATPKIGAYSTPIPTSEPEDDAIKIMQNGTSKEQLAHYVRYPVWGRHCIGSGSVKFTNSPMRIEDINYLSPYGDVVGGHITPIDHMYFEVKDRSLGRDIYEVRAIQDALIYNIGVRDLSTETNEAQERDWRLDMAHTCTFASYFDLLTSVTPEIEEEWRRTLRDGEAEWDGIFVEGGQLIGYAGGQSLDFGVYDYELQLSGLINPNAYAEREPWKIHTVDPFQYFPSEVTDLLLAKMTRTVEPRAGKIDYDVKDTLAGNWFEQDTDWYNGINQRKYWEGHLSIAPHQIDPTFWRIGIGFLDVDDNNFVILGEQDPLEIDAKSAPITYELKRYKVYIPESPDKKWWDEPFVEGTIYGVRVFPETVGTVMLHLEKEGLLKLEVFLNKTPDEITSFTNVARLYQR